MINEYKLQDGSKRYMFQAYIGTDPLTGKQKKTTRRGFKTKKEASLALSRLKVEVEENGMPNTRKMTFKAVYDLWLVQHENTVKPGTYATTLRYANLHILPKIGNTRIDRLNVVNCQRIVNEWSDHFNSAKYPKGIVHQVLDYAIAMELIKDNAMRKVPLPTGKKVKLEINNFYDSKELKHFFKCLDDYDNEKMKAFFRILSFTGARKGEALALTWSDIDFHNKTINISKGISLDKTDTPYIGTPKTKKSIRLLSVDEETINILKIYKRKQAADLLRYGINALSKDQLLFTYQGDRIYNPTYVNDWLNTIIKKYDLKKITVHGFRHTHCSLLFEMGTPIQVVQERLGHENIKTTMDIYTHVTTKARDEVADNFAKYVNF